MREEKLGMLLRGTDEGKHREYRKQKLMLLRGSGEGKNREQKIGTFGEAAARAEMGNVATHVVPWSGNKKKKSATMPCAASLKIRPVWSCILVRSLGKRKRTDWIKASNFRGISIDHT